MTPPRVSAVLVSYNTREHLLRALASLRAVTLPCEAIVVDNASADGSAEAVEGAFPRTRVLRGASNQGFAAAMNRGIGAAAGTYVLALNSDAELQAGALEAMAAILDARPDVALVGPRTRNADGTIQLSFGPDLAPLDEWHQARLVRGVRRRDPRVLAAVEALAARERDADWVSGSCFLARREALLAVGLFDEGFFLYEEDADLCLRLRKARHRILFTPAAEVVHAQGESGKGSDLARREYDRSHLRYYRKHNGRFLTLLLQLSLALRGRSVG